MSNKREEAVTTNKEQDRREKIREILHKLVCRIYTEPKSHCMPECDFFKACNEEIESNITALEALMKEDTNDKP